MQPRNEHKMWNPWKTLVMHNSREMLARLLNKLIWHLWTTYKMQNVSTFYPKYAIYVWCSGVSHTMIQDDQYGSMICNVAMLWLLLTSSLLSFSFCLKAYSFFLYGHYVKCTNQDSNFVYAGTILWHKDDMLIPRWGMYAMVGSYRWSLKCTSSVARQYSNG